MLIQRFKPGDLVQWLNEKGIIDDLGAHTYVVLILAHQDADSQYLVRWCIDTIYDRVNVVEKQSLCASQWQVISRV